MTGLFVLLALSSLLAPVSAFGQEDDEVIVIPPSTSRRPAASSDATVVVSEGGALVRLESNWFRWISAYGLGDKDVAEEPQKAITQVAARLQLRRLTEYSSAAVALANKSGSDANKREWGYAVAESLDPLNPEVGFARLAFARERGNFLEMPKGYFSGYRVLFVNPQTRAIAMRNAGSILLVTLVVAAAVYGLLLFYKYARPLYHDAWELFERRTPGRRARFFGLVLLGLPLFLWLGFYWLCAYWLALAMVYATVLERVLGFAVLLIAMVALPAADWIGYRALAAHSPVLEAATMLRDQQFRPRLLERVQNLQKVLPGDADLLFLLGNMQQRIGQDAEAMESYRGAIALRADFPEAELNLGNLYFGEGQSELALAIQQYQRAIKIRPQMAVAHFNLSQAYAESYSFKESEGALIQAKTVDENAVADWLSAENPQKVVTLWYSVEEADAKVSALNRIEEVRRTYGHYRDFDPFGAVINEVTLASFVALLLALFLLIVRRKARAGECVKCGRTFCDRCKRHEESSIYCTQCIHIYLKKGGVSVETKVNKLEEVKRFQRVTTRARKLFSIFVPGSSQLIEGRAAYGFVLSAAFLFVGIAFLCRGHLYPQTDILMPWQDPLAAIGAGAALVGIWLLANLPVLRDNY